MAKKRLEKLKNLNNEDKVKGDLFFLKSSGCKSPKSRDNLNNSNLFKRKENEKKKNIEQQVKKNSNEFLRSLKLKRLFYCVLKNDLQMLLLSGFDFDKDDVNSVDENGNIALHYACLNKNIKFIEFLIGKGADVNKKGKNGNTPVHIACKTNKLEVNLFLGFKKFL